MSRAPDFAVCRVALGYFDPKGELSLFPVIADSGASNTIMDGKIYQDEFENTPNVISVEHFDNHLNLSAANSGALRIDRMAYVRLMVTKRTSLDIPVLIANKLSVPMLLGNDVMGDAGAALDFNENTVYLTTPGVLPMLKDK